VTSVELQPEIAANFVREAILGKYRLDAAEVRSAVTDTIWAVGGASEAELLALLTPISSALDDIRNQTIVLLLMERFWRFSVPPRPISALHAASQGHPGKPEGWRTEALVPDFGGVPPTPPAAIPAAIEEVERVVVAMVGALSGARVAAQAAFLAYTHAAIVRIHPFPDGNGRAARFTAQLLLRSWGRALMPLPKVRNDAAWRCALAGAIDGDSRALANEFRKRLAGNPPRG
jgi:hypothetical protein